MNRPRLACLLACALIAVRGIEVTVPLQPNAIFNALENASDGDVLRLVEGQYNELNSLIIDKNVSIVGASTNNVFVRFSAATTPVAFSVVAPASRLDSFTIVNTDNQTLSPLFTPYSLQVHTLMLASRVVVCVLILLMLISAEKSRERFFFYFCSI